MDADVIVVGAGLAGLVAAFEAERAGRSVIVVDGEPIQSVGGQAHWSLGGLFLVDSPEQRRLGVRDSAELAWADWQGSAGFDRDSDFWPRQWAEAYVAFAAGEKRSWLYGLGLRWFPVVGWAERGGHCAPGHGNSVPRFHLTWGTGPGVVKPFADQVLGSAAVRLRPRHRVTEVEPGADGVGVHGYVLAPSTVARGESSGREVVGSFSLRAPTVVVAAGGIGGNHDLVRRSWPRDWGEPPSRMISGVPDYVDGSMLPVLERAGGRLINADRMWHYPEGVVNHSPIWPAHGIRILPGPSSLWLDATGTRLPAPNFPGFDALGTLRQITASGHPYSWFVCDVETAAKEFALSGSEQNADLTGRNLRLVAQRALPGPTAEVQAFIDSGVDFLTASTVAELAARMNQLAGSDGGDGSAISADALLALIEARDPQQASGLGKDPQQVAINAARGYVGDKLIRIARPHPWLDPKRPGAGTAGSGGPLLAVRLHVLTRKTLGGVETDLQARVLRPDGQPIPGLYAAGETSGFGGGGMHGYRALEGTFLGGCLFSGRVAGRAAAEQAG